jgi:NADPH:quinone reductase-like Zn-dependent oxidoreductase
LKAERIIIPRAGGPDVLTLQSFTPQAPGAGEVAIEVEAVGINLADVFCRLGLYDAAPPLPFSPGFEVSGVVTAVGEGVTAFARGDRVFAVTLFGGYSSHLVIGTERVRRLPDHWSHEEGAAFPVVFLTAYHGLVHLGQLNAGETVVVQSAAGGVGIAGCQLARAMGATVIGTVGSESKRSVALEAGAQNVVVSRDYDVWKQINEITGGDGVDVILETVGGSQMRQGFNSLRPGGRLLLCGFSDMMQPGGARNWLKLAWRYLRTPRFNPFKLVPSNRSVTGFHLVYLWNKVDLLESALGRMLSMVERGEVKPVVGRTFPFERAGEAHTHLQSRQAIGKVILLRERDDRIRSS